MPLHRLCPQSGVGLLIAAALPPRAAAAPQDCLPILRPFGANLNVSHAVSFVPATLDDNTTFYRMNSGLFTWYQAILKDFDNQLVATIKLNVTVFEPGSVNADLLALQRIVAFTLGSTTSYGDPAACWEEATTHSGLGMQRYPDHVFAHGAHWCTIKGGGVWGGICAPKACSGDDVAMAMAQVAVELLQAVQPLKFIRPYININAIMAAKGHVVCTDEQDPQYGKPYSREAIHVIALIVSLASLVIISTAVLYVGRCVTDSDAPFRKWVNKVVGIFDAYGNTVLLLKARPGTTSFLDCMRFLSIEWIILGHAYSDIAANMAENSDKATRNFDFRTYFIPSAYLGVDTFYFLSAFLACRKLIKEVPLLLSRSDCPAPVTLIKTYFLTAVLRWLRLVPLLGFVMLFVMHLYSYLGSGPIWVEDDFNCADSWWRNLLFINNGLDFSEMCIGWVWYLANDFQFSLLLPFVAMPYAFPGDGVGPLLGRLFALAVILGLLITNYWAGYTKYDEKDAYLRPWHRVAPYAYGMALAVAHDALCRCRPPWRLERSDDDEATALCLPDAARPSVNGDGGAAAVPALDLSKLAPAITVPAPPVACPAKDGDGPPSPGLLRRSVGVVRADAGAAAFRRPAVRLACYASSAGLCFSCTYLTWRQNYDDNRGPWLQQHMVDASATYWDKRRQQFFWLWYAFGWGLGLALFCLPLIYGGGGLVARVMRHPLWAPFAKLTYGTYLIHPILIRAYCSSQWSRLVFTDYNMLLWWLSISVLAWACSYAMWLLVEAPAANIVGIFARKLM